MALKLANNAASTLAAPISASATSLTLTTGGGSDFPILGTNDYTIVTIVSAGNPNTFEIIKVTAISGDSFTTIVRAQEGTTALNWNANDLVQTRPTGGTITSRQPNILTYAGNPNGNVAGNISPTQDLVWDTSHLVLWICTTAGTASTAVWKMTDAETLNNTLDNGSGAASFLGNLSTSGNLSATGNLTISGVVNLFTSSGNVPAGMSGEGGAQLVLLTPPVLLTSSPAKNIATLLSIGTAYASAKIAIIRAVAQIESGSAPVTTNIFFANNSSPNNILYKRLAVNAEVSGNTVYGSAQFMSPLITGANPSIYYEIVEGGTITSAYDFYLDGFIQ